MSKQEIFPLPADDFNVEKDGDVIVDPEYAIFESDALAEERDPAEIDEELELAIAADAARGLGAVAAIETKPVDQVIPKPAVQPTQKFSTKPTYRDAASAAANDRDED